MNCRLSRTCRCSFINRILEISCIASGSMLSPMHCPPRCFYEKPMTLCPSSAHIVLLYSDDLGVVFVLKSKDCNTRCFGDVIVSAAEISV